MTALFFTCAVLGGAVLVLQVLAGVLGMGHDGADGAHDGHGHEIGDGLNLFSVRAIAAGAAFFGLGGLASGAAGLGAPIALAAGAVAGGAAMAAVAILMRSLLRFESDGTVSIAGAVGATGTVYLSIPGERGGAGKVHLNLQNRTVELQAVTPEIALPTGASILVIDVADQDTVVVVRNPLLTEASNAVT